MTFPLQQPINALLLIGFLVASGYLLVTPGNLSVFLGLVGISLVLGVLFVLPIGGAICPW
jgi:NAD(P) transhydrogenase subunit beta